MKRRLILAMVMMMAFGGTDAVAADPSDEVTLRRWYLGLLGSSGRSEQWDVFGRTDLPSATVEDKGSGGGFQFGHRFGGRFLLGLQLTMVEYPLGDRSEYLRDVMALVTGTVLFRERHTLQPFLRGGFGGGGAILRGAGGDLIALGPAVTAGGGLQVRLSSRFSLEFEVTADFRNIVEVEENPADGPSTKQSVKASHQNWRSGLGIVFWF